MGKKKNVENENVVSQTTPENTSKTKKAKKVKEPMSKGEKIFTIVVSSVAAVAILLIVILTIVLNKDSVFKEYEGLDENNVYEYIKYDEIIKKLDNKEEFYLVIANKNYTYASTNCEEAIISLDKIAKENDITKIYYISLNNLSTEEQYEIYYNRSGKLTRDVLLVPCVFNFTSVDGVYTSKETSGLYKVTDFAKEETEYSAKWDALYKEYFRLCLK